MIEDLRQQLEEQGNMRDSYEKMKTSVAEGEEKVRKF